MKKVLLVVDYQNDFVSGSLGFPSAKDLDTGIAKKIFEYGEGNVFFTKDTHGKDYLNSAEGKALPVPHCIMDSRGWQIFGETNFALIFAKAQSVNKQSFGMNSEELEFLGIPKDVDSIEIVGLVTNICVISNAIILKANYPDAEIIINAKLCDSFDKTLHEKALDVLEGLQFTVINR